MKSKVDASLKKCEEMCEALVEENWTKVFMIEENKKRKEEEFRQKFLEEGKEINADEPVSTQAPPQVQALPLPPQQHLAPPQARELPLHRRQQGPDIPPPGGELGGKTPRFARKVIEDNDDKPSQNDDISDTSENDEAVGKKMLRQTPRPPLSSTKDKPKEETMDDEDQPSTPPTPTMEEYFAKHERPTRRMTAEEQIEYLGVSSEDEENRGDKNINTDRVPRGRRE
ncbi:Aste57867_22631 [Aphanomyces stellatus]|uniref:Aste57867_22631 protein n=1 Tax=Aphanomyces stellatus TaxID=120398 RepID=A0A485LL79_9STRA|nr:hypothetical protein As57867_022561 [Aphanomyces stellatus]VFT99286.1 Aste57867_22631 [Aphanomyces stellatus]